MGSYTEKDKNGCVNTTADAMRRWAEDDDVALPCCLAISSVGGHQLVASHSQIGASKTLSLFVTVFSMPFFLTSPMPAAAARRGRRG